MRFVIILIVSVVLYFILRHLFRQNAKKFTRYFLFTALGLFITGLLALAITGRLHWLFVLIAGLIPWMRRLIPLWKLLPLMKMFQGFRSMGGMRGHRTTGQQSNVSSRFFEMTLNHDNGAITGKVLTGELVGHRLQDLNEKQLHQLLQECRFDHDSYALLCSYLNYRYGNNWQNQFDVGSEGEKKQPSSSQTHMTREEALDILGLEEPVDKQAIIKAHRSMMQRFHPDRGGSNYLAAKINDAKDLLLFGTSN